MGVFCHACFLFLRFITQYFCGEIVSHSDRIRILSQSRKEPDMPIQLFAHNQNAYEAALAMLDETGKAAVVHPTGTEKSFIGFKLCENHPDSTVCWLSTSEYIFQTQIENLKSTGADVPENIKFFTYAKLANMDFAEIEEIQPDYIICDEFHRAGAAMWGLGVQSLLQTYPNVPVLGLSATHIRYLDNQRNMAEELFDGNTATLPVK